MHSVFFAQPVIGLPYYTFQIQQRKSTFLCTPNQPSFYHGLDVTKQGPKLVKNNAKCFKTGPTQLKMSTADINQDPMHDSEASQRSFRRNALIALFFVPPMWGSYTVLGRFIFNNSSTITPAFMNMFGYGWSFIIVNILQILTYFLTRRSKKHATTFAPDNQIPVSSTGALSKKTSILTPRIWLYGLELCMYIVVGNLCELAGLQNATASRTAFLVQTTTVMVPLLELIFPLVKKFINAIKNAFNKLLGLKAKQSPNIKVDFNPWTLVASVFALFGLGTFSGSGHSTDGVGLVRSLLSAWTPHDFMVLIGAAFYSVHCLRLGYIIRLPFLREGAPDSSSSSNSARSSELARVIPTWLANASPVTLLTIAKSACQFLTTFIYLLFEQSRFVQQNNLALPGKAIFSLGAFLAEPHLYTFRIPMMIFMSTFGCGISSWLQSYGQRGVPSSMAAVIYAFQPIWASIFAAFALGEFLRPNEYLGGAIIVTACIVASNTSKETL